jgi:hypothetical protein
MLSNVFVEAEVALVFRDASNRKLNPARLLMLPGIRSIHPVGSPTFDVVLDET